MTNQTTAQHPPPLCFYYHGKPLHVLRHDGQWRLHSNDVLAVIGRRLGRRIQQLLAADPTHENRPEAEDTQGYWPATALLRALRRSNKLLARQLRVVEQTDAPGTGAVAASRYALGASLGAGGRGRGAGESCGVAGGIGTGCALAAFALVADA